MDWLTSVDNTPSRGAPGSATGEFVNGLDVFFRSRPKYWRSIGAQRQFHCQFRIEGGGDFFITVDSDGGRVRPGTIDAADATWQSDVHAFGEALRGRLADGHPVRVLGDVNQLRSVFKALVS